MQAAGAAVPGLRREAVRRGRRLRAGAGGGPDQRAVRRAVADGGGERRCGQRDGADGRRAAQRRGRRRCAAWVGELAAAVGAEVLVSDDADGFKTAADDAGLAHQVCKKHVLDNTERLVAELSAAVGGRPGRLAGGAGGDAGAGAADLAEVLRLGAGAAGGAGGRRQRSRRSTGATRGRARRERASRGRWRTGCGCSRWIGGSCGRA